MKYKNFSFISNRDFLFMDVNCPSCSVLRRYRVANLFRFLYTSFRPFMFGFLYSEEFSIFLYDHLLLLYFWHLQSTNLGRVFIFSHWWRCEDHFESKFDVIWSMWSEITKVFPTVPHNFLIIWNIKIFLLSQIAIFYLWT